MKKIFFILVLIYFPVFLFASYSEWHVMETEQYSVYYHPTYKNQAEEALNELSLNRPLVEKIVGNSPKKVTVVLEDSGQIANGYATVFPEKMGLWIAQPQGQSFTINHHNYVRMLTTHELTHAAHLTAVSGNPKTLQKYFGNLFYPNIYSPRWLSEGLAVYVESQNSSYEGRLNDASTHVLFKSSASKKIMTDISDMTLYGYSYMGGHTPYIYGGRFIQYLSKRFGQDSLSKFIYDYSKRTSAPASIIAPGYSLDVSAKRVFGKSFKELISDWQLAEQDEIGDFKIEGEKLTQSGWRKSMFRENDGNVYFTESYLHQGYPFLYRIGTEIKRFSSETGKFETLYKSDRDINLPIVVTNESIYFTHPDLKQGFENIELQGFGMTQTLYKLNKNTQQKRVMLSDNMTAFCVNKENILTYVTRSSNQFTSTMKQFRHTTVKNLAELPLFISEIIPLDSDFYVIGKTQFEPWSIYKINGKTYELSKLIHTPFSLYALNADKDGLIFTADRNSERHTYKYFFKTNAVSKMSRGSDAAKGILVKNKLIASTLTIYGEDLISQEVTEGEPVQFQEKFNTYSPSYEISIASKPGFWKSHERLLKPHTRLGIINLGQDDLGLLKYSILYSPFVGLNVSAYSQHFRPITWGVQNAFQQYSIFLNYPVYRSLSSGVKDFTILSELRDDQRVYLGYQVDFSDRYQAGRIATIGNPSNDTYRFTWDQFLFYKNITAKLRISGVENEDQYDVLRGFEYSLRKNDKGYSTSAELMYRLNTPRTGYWPVTVGLESGTFLGAFYDYSDFIQKHSEGVFLKQGVQLTVYNLGIVGGIGYAYSDGKSSPFITIEGGYRF